MLASNPCHRPTDKQREEPGEGAVSDERIKLPFRNA